MTTNIIKKCKVIKIVMTDVDGVLTDGGMYYSNKGDVMKNLSLFILLYILVINPTYSQDDQEVGAGMGFRDYQFGAIQSEQSNSSTIVSKHRTGENKILTGIRRLVPQEYPTIQTAIDSCRMNTRTARNSL